MGINPEMPLGDRATDSTVKPKGDRASARADTPTNETRARRVSTTAADSLSQPREIRCKSEIPLGDGLIARLDLPAEMQPPHYRRLAKWCAAFGAEDTEYSLHPRG